MKGLAIIGVAIIAFLMATNTALYLIGHEAWIKNSKAIMIAEAIIGLLALSYFGYSMYMDKWYA